jgi:hypothetical protein
MVGLPNESPTFCFDRDELSTVEFFRNFVDIQVFI